MAYEQLIGQIVEDGQWGNSAIAEIHRRSIQASEKQGDRMWWLTAAIAVLAVVQIVLAALAALGGLSSSAARLDDLRSDTQANRAEMREDLRGLDERIRGVEIAIGGSRGDEHGDGARSGRDQSTSGH